ncbi:alginate O-acetyltransferase AlgX-related protein [Allohahella marinimesophila]|uniref:Alginate biosynthesis protein AlgX n=1 Tax=Allohahella marinimesophila TaxID=1054972 RepID=A0ABP7PLL1_9GAMM
MLSCHQNMRAFFSLAIFLLWSSGASASDAKAEAPCEDLECLLCDGLTDSSHYQEGVMKAMSQIAPGHDNWLFRSDFDLSNDFGIPDDMVPQFRRLIAALKNLGIEVAMVVQPTRGMLHADKVREDKRYGFAPDLARMKLTHFLAQLQEAGAIVPDVTRLLDMPKTEDYFFRRDHHWTPFGARVTAELTVEALLAHPVYEDLAEKQFVTESVTKIAKDGTMNRALRQICGNNYGFQYVQGYQTVPAAEDGADALFGDSGDPEVVLIGTSNSAARDEAFKNYNFEGFLKQGLSVDMLNYALPGAGQDGSLLNYLLSEDYDPEAPPKLIIWEHPANWRLEDPLMYRELLPAIVGGCALNKKLVEPLTTALPAMAAGTRVELYANAGRQQKDFTNQQGFIELNFSDANIRDFYVITYYDNGMRDKVWYRRSAAVSGGRYLLELSTDATVRGANLLSVFLEPSEPFATDASVEFQLCGY